MASLPGKGSPNNLECVRHRGRELFLQEHRVNQKLVHSLVKTTSNLNFKVNQSSLDENLQQTCGKKGDTCFFWPVCSFRKSKQNGRCCWCPTEAWLRTASATSLTSATESSSWPRSMENWLTWQLHAGKSRVSLVSWWDGRGSHSSCWFWWGLELPLGWCGRFHNLHTCRKSRANLVAGTARGCLSSLEENQNLSMMTL